MPTKPKHVQQNQKAIAHPFDPAIMKRAKEIADRYHVVIRYDNGEYFGRGLELPGAMDDGNSPDECFANTHQAMVTMVAYMLEEGQIPPRPLSNSIDEAYEVQDLKRQ